jgi:hypothetical protein
MFGAPVAVDNGDMVRNVAVLIDALKRYNFPGDSQIQSAIDTVGRQVSASGARM